MLINLFKEYLNYPLSKKQVDLFAKYYQKLIEYNKHTNLTRITSLKDVYVKHFLDSAMLSKLLDFNKIKSMCDMGSGAGFPAIPILILYPEIKMTLVDSQIKRVTFLNELKKELKLEYTVIHQRAERYSQENNLKYDLITVRALTELSKSAFKTLKSKLIEVDKFELPYDLGYRANLLIQKEKHVKGYPREYSQILKKPL